MRILLVYPYFLENRLSEDDIRVLPQGIYYIAALLQSSGYDVQILDWHNIDRSPQAIDAFLARAQPDIIGFSILHANRWGGIDIARIARRVCPQAAIVFGGVGATHLWRHLLTHFPEIDYIVLGEGELTFLELVDALAGRTDTPPRSIEGLALRNCGRPVKTARRDLLCDLDRLPNPAEYFTYNHVALTRGCVHNCTFCGSPRFWDRRVRHHSVKYFVRQLEALCARGVHFFHVTDDTFTLDGERVVAICHEIIRKKLPITWTAISRVDSVSERILRWMRRAGCIQISFGVESGSSTVRKRLGKQTSDRRIRQAFAMTQSYGIMARAYFIYGCPQESDETIQQTIDLMHAIKPLSTIFYILDVFPGTTLCDDVLPGIGGGDDIWLNRVEDILYFETDPDLTRRQILKWGQQLRSGFHRHLPEYVEALELVDDRSLYAHHADFCSRLALTFHLGDYARLEEIPGKDRLARKLYSKALSYRPDARAYLGLGMLHQKSGDDAKSIEILTRGLAHFPDDPQLNICLSISYMNANRHRQALTVLESCDSREQVLALMVDCCRVLGLHERAEAHLRELDRVRRKEGGG